MKVQIIAKPDFAKIARNIKFGVAVGLTRTAKAAQKEIISTIENTFTTRGNWYKPSNKFGIRITTATKESLESAVHTEADWLLAHEHGGDKRPRGDQFAVPTENVRRNKRQIIPRAQRPRQLKGTFVLQTRKGPVLFQRLFANKAGKFTARKLKTNRGARLVALYGLEKQVHIQKRSTFFEPAKRIAAARVGPEVKEGIAFALRTMK